MVCLVLGLFVSISYARQLTRPIVKLRKAVLQLAGRRSLRAGRVSSRDEVGELADSFNRMTESLLQRDTILQSVRFAAQQFLSADDWRLVIDEVLASLGQSADASRVYVFENHDRRAGPSMTSQRYEWTAPHAHPEIDNPGLRNSATRTPAWPAGSRSWMSGSPHRRYRPGSSAGGEWAVLAPQKIQSLALVPVRVAGRWWGVIGLDECRYRRVWSEAEITSLRAAADTLGAAIERHQARKALVLAKEAAEAASEAKSQFLANMSHEIRTPITGVMGMLHLLHRTELNTKQSRYVNNAVTAAGTLLTVIGDVLDFSKIEAGRLELEVTDVLDSGHAGHGRARFRGEGRDQGRRAGLPTSRAACPGRSAATRTGSGRSWSIWSRTR